MTRRGVSRAALGLGALALSGCNRDREAEPFDSNGYAVTAQFSDIMAEPYWEASLGPAMARAFSGFNPGEGWALDVGAGTGLSTAAVLRALPNARVMAIEPDPAMRAALMTRVVADDRMRRQVSIIPAGLFEADIPDRFDAVSMISMLHHFVPEDRRRFWQLLSDRLSPVGRAVIEIQLPTNERIPPTRMQRAQIGDVEYEGWMEASPVAEAIQRWRMRYRASRDGRVLSDLSTSFDMHVIDFATVEREATASGLRARQQQDFALIEQG